MLLADLRPVPPAHLPGGSLEGWILLGIVLALILAGGLLLTSRR